MKQVDKAVIIGALHGSYHVRLTDLLAYAKVGNKNVKFQSINLQEPVCRAITLLRPAIDESGAKINVADLP